MKLLRYKPRSQRGQTILEYFMVLTAFVIPVAAGIRASLEENDKKPNLIRYLLKDSYGGKGQPGVIGRPYP